MVNLQFSRYFLKKTKTFTMIGFEQPHFPGADGIGGFLRAPNFGPRIGDAVTPSAAHEIQCHQSRRNSPS